jgi:hypothetical protein
MARRHDAVERGVSMSATGGMVSLLLSYPALDRFGIITPAMQAK